MFLFSSQDVLLVIFDRERGDFGGYRVRSHRRVLIGEEGCLEDEGFVSVLGIRNRDWRRFYLYPSAAASIYLSFLSPDMGDEAKI